MTNKTPDAVVERITEEARTGRQAWLSGDLATAEDQFLSAWSLVPEPKTAYDYGQILSRGIVTFYRDTSQFDKAKKWLDVMRAAYGSNWNASVEFLAATVHFEAGELDEAFTRFDALYKETGQRLFQGVKPDYLKFYKRRAAQLKPTR